MAIMVECNSCGKQYSADPTMGGKRVKCKQCGNVFSIPTFNAAGEPELDEQDDLSALSALAESERSRSGEAVPNYNRGGGRDPGATRGPSASRAGTVVGGKGLRGGEGLAKSSMARSGDAEEIPLETPEDFGRPNVRFNFPFAKELDQFLPPVLLIGGLLIVALATTSMDPLAKEPNQPGAAWIPWARLGVFVLLYVLLAGPLAIHGMRMAGRALRFQMPRRSKLRGYASFMPAFVLGVLMFLASGGQLFGLILGSILGLMLSFGAVHLLYRLRYNEMPMTAVYSGSMFGIGAVVGLGIVVGLNLLLSSVLVATKKADRLAASPFAAGLNWPKTETPAPPKSRPQLAQGNHAQPPTPTTAPSGGSNDAVPGMPPTSAPSASDSLTVALSNAAPHPAPPPSNEAAKPPTAPQQAEVVVESRANSSLPEIRQTEPRLVTSVKESPVAGGFQQVLYPAVPGPWTAVLRGQPEHGTIERWNTPAGQEWAQEGARTRTRDPGTSDRYVLSPDGDLLARMAKFPFGAAVVYSFSNQSLGDALKLDEHGDDPIDNEAFGFASPERLLISRHNPNKQTDAFELWNAQSKTMVSRFDVAPHDASAVTTALSPDGRTLAVVARGIAISNRDVGPAAIYLYDIEKRGNAALLRKIPIADYHEDGLPRPTGLAFSPDGKRIAATFEQRNNGLLVEFETAAAKPPILSRAYLPMPARGALDWTGSSIVWVGDNAILLYGQSILHAKTGEQIGETGFPDPKYQQFMAPTDVQLTYRDVRGELRIAVLTLDTAKIAELAPAPAAAPAR